MSEASSDRPPSVNSSAVVFPRAPTDKRWVRFDDSVSTETEISEPSFSDNNSVASTLPGISFDPTGHNGPPVPPKVSLASSSGRRSGSLNSGHTGHLSNTASTNNSNNNVNPQQSRFTTPASDVSEINVGMLENQHASSISSRPSSAGSSWKDPNSIQLTNGKPLANISPGNQSCPWITPPVFDPYKIPASLTSNKLTLPVEEYVTGMERLITDYRFKSYTVLYRRLIVGWLILAAIILVGALLGFKGVVSGMALFGIALGWFFVLGLGILGCLVVKSRIDAGKQLCVADINLLFSKHNLLMGLDDHGQLSCHKISILFIYFNIKDCLPTIARQIQLHEEVGGSKEMGRAKTGDYMPSRQTFEDQAQHLMLHYSQPYVKAIFRKQIKFPARPMEGVSDLTPLHCSHSQCLCQYIQEKSIVKN